MAEQRIAIVGSVDESRKYELPIRNAAAARDAAEKLGGALAREGYSLMVYSADAGYIERDVVRGFVKSGKAKPKSICILFPSGNPEAAAFPERADHEQLFELRQDNSTSWEITFYRSLAVADGMVLLGGGRSTLITGVVALTYRIPLLALAAYGGYAEKVWGSLVAGRDLPDDEDIQSMAAPGGADVVKRWIRSLENQSQTKKVEVRKRQRTWPSLAALLLLLVWVSTLPFGFLLAPPGSTDAAVVHRTLFTFLVFLAPLVAGASGATVRTLLPTTGGPTLHTTVLGTGAAAVASILYVLGQIVGNQSPNFVILAFAVVFGFVAGFTFDAVFKKLESVQALKTGVLSQKNS